MAPFHAPDLLRTREEENSGRVAQIELFFDLVFVFTVTQLSHTLLADFTPLGGLKTAMLFSAAWWAWIYTTWVTNWLDPDRQPVRMLMLALMLAGLVFSTALPDAFGKRGLVFAAAYAGMQLGRCLFMLWALRRWRPDNYRNFQRILAWTLLTAAFWIAGGFAGGGAGLSARLWLWLLALGLELAGPAASFRTPGLGRSVTSDWDVEPGHLAERCSAFILIALGETLTVAAATFSQTAWTRERAVTFGFAFCGVAALWWIYFDTAADRTRQAFSDHHDPGAVARVAYTYVHAGLVAGIILTAAAAERVLAEPAARSDLVFDAVLLGGAGLYLFSNALFRRQFARRFAPSHTLGLAALAGLALASPLLSRLVLGALTSATLIGVAALGRWLFRRQQRRRGEPA